MLASVKASYQTEQPSLGVAPGPAFSRCNSRGAAHLPISGKGDKQC